MIAHHSGDHSLFIIDRRSYISLICKPHTVIVILIVIVIQNQLHIHIDIESDYYCSHLKSSKFTVTVSVTFLFTFNLVLFILF